MYEDDCCDQRWQITLCTVVITPPTALTVIQLCAESHPCMCIQLMVYLALLHRCGVFIAHGTDLHPSLSLLISLPEELLHDSLRPLSIHSQRFRGIAQVSTVHHVPQHLHKHTATRHTLYCVCNVMNAEFRCTWGSSVFNQTNLSAAERRRCKPSFLMTSFTWFSLPVSSFSSINCEYKSKIQSSASKTRNLSQPLSSFPNTRSSRFHFCSWFCLPLWQVRILYF